MVRPLSNCKRFLIEKSIIAVVNKNVAENAENLSKDIQHHHRLRCNDGPLPLRLSLTSHPASCGVIGLHFF